MILKLRTFTKGNSEIKLFGKIGYGTANSDLIDISAKNGSGEIKKLKSNGYTQKIENIEIECDTQKNKYGEIIGNNEIENYFK